MESNLIEFVKILNKKDSLPSLGLKRNSVYYPLITYINHTIALLLSEEYDNVVLFIRRADKEIENLKGSGFGQENYLILCEHYLQILSYALLGKKLISESCIELMPNKFKED